MDPLVSLIPFGAEVDPAIFVSLVVAVLGGGGIGALAAFRKAGNEADGIAAQTLIAVNSELRVELRRRDDELKELRERVAILEERERRRSASD